jgi:23S rRNA-/tRNA-specific pseudouridylate synthase
MADEVERLARTEGRQHQLRVAKLALLGQPVAQQLITLH